MSAGSYDGGIVVLPTNFHAVKKEKTIPGRLLYRIKSLTEKAQQKNWDSHIYFVTLEIAYKNKRQNLSLLFR